MKIEKIDKIETIENSVFQHGKHSNRIYLMSLDTKNTERIMHILESLAESNGYTKIIARIPERSKLDFLSNSYLEEAHIPAMFHGMEDGYFMSKYFDTDRTDDQNRVEIERIIKDSLDKTEMTYSGNLQKWEIVKMTNGEVQEMAEFYQSVIESYPFPIFDPEYLALTMYDKVEYFGIRDEGKLIALASAEKDKENACAEATDFAVAEDYRRQGLAQQLLVKIEEKMKKENMMTIYTIARALSPGINKAFSKLGYSFAGTLTNNTAIAGSIESMNVWYKSLN